MLGCLPAHSAHLPSCSQCSPAPQVIEGALLEIFGSDEDGVLSKRCFGIVSDMELVNVLAAKQLGTKYPWLINLNCAAHGINNACKVRVGHTSNHRLIDLVHVSASDCSCTS